MNDVARQPFAFLPADGLRDDALELVLRETESAEASMWRVPTYRFQICLRGDGPVIGHINLRVGPVDCLKYAGHIGYAIDPAHRGNHFAERAARLVLPLARRHSMSEIWITCNPDNPASQRTIERLGATYIETVDVPEDCPMSPGALRQKRRYCLELDPLP